MDTLSPGRVRDLLERASCARVLIVGDVMLDRYVSGPVDRVSPEAPVPVVRVEREWHSIGGAGNVAANVIALGAACTLVGCAGDDADGAVLAEELASKGVDTTGLALTSGRPTTVKTRVIGQHQQIVRVDREVAGDVGEPLERQLAAAVSELATGQDVLVAQDYDKGVLAPGVVRSLLEAGADAPLLVDPKRRRFFAYAGATVFKPNARELRDALGEPVRPAEGRWLDAIRERLRCEHLLVTLGADGMALKSAGAPLIRLAAGARGVFDVSGAGDTVTAALAVAMAAGASVPEAAMLASHAAALEVAKPGVQTVTPSEILAQVSTEERGWSKENPFEEHAR